MGVLIDKERAKRQSDNHEERSIFESLLWPKRLEGNFVNE